MDGWVDSTTRTQPRDGPRAFDAGPHERLPGAPAAERARDGEHPDLGLAGTGDVRQGAAVRHEGHAAGHPVPGGGDQDVGVRGPPGDVAQLARYGSVSPKSSSPSPR